jgi:multiple sugar transport system ATP-binding protein
VNDVEPKDRDIAMVFQNYALYPHMDVRQNLGFGLKMRGFPRREIEARVQEAADILGIHELLDRRPKQLSGGQRQRVAVGRAIVRKPQVFLFDEPLSNLDAKLRVAMRAEISKLHRRLGATIVYVTHDQVEAMTMASRIFVMNSGTVQQSGAPMEVYRHPASQFVAGFIGSPGMNFVEAALRQEEDALFVDRKEFRLRLPESFRVRAAPNVGRTVLFGVRPEDITVTETAASSADRRISARIDVVETLGYETFVHFTCGDRTLVARLEAPQQPIEVGRVLELTVDMARTHLFDTETMRTIV